MINRQTEAADREDRPAKPAEQPSLNFSAWQTARGSSDSDDSDENLEIDCFEFGQKTITISFFENAQLNKSPIKIQTIS